MLGKEAKNLLGAVNSQAVAWMEFFTRLVLWILDCIAVNVFTLIRSHFGERFMTVINWFFGSAMMSTFMIFSLFTEGPKSVTLRVLWGPAVLLALLYHLWVIRRKNKRGIEWHSYSSGIPHLLRVPVIARYVPVEIVEKWLEPAAVFAVAYVIRWIDQGFGIMLSIVAAVLCLRAFVGYYLERQQFLDQRDARIMSKYMNAVMEGRPAEETAGFTIARSNRELIEQEIRATTEAPRQRTIPDAVNAMLDPTPDSIA
jgi:hypothetical protein